MLSLSLFYFCSYISCVLSLPYILVANGQNYTVVDWFQLTLNGLTIMVKVLQMGCLKLSFTIMIDRDFLCNININEANSLPDLVQSINHDSKNELNSIEHSLYYSDQEYKACMSRTNGELRMLNLNIGGLNAKFDKFNFFLTECNDDKFPLSVITLQETHVSQK